MTDHTSFSHSDYPRLCDPHLLEYRSYARTYVSAQMHVWFIKNGGTNKTVCCKREERAEREQTAQREKERKSQAGEKGDEPAMSLIGGNHGAVLAHNARACDTHAHTHKYIFYSTHAHTQHRTHVRIHAIGHTHLDLYAHTSTTLKFQSHSLNPSVDHSPGH